MDTLNDKNDLLREATIYEFGCRNMLHLLFELLCFYCLY